MRSLPISLLLVVVIAIFGVGFLLDTVFERYNNSPTDSVAQISVFGQGIADMLDSAEYPLDIIAHWSVGRAYSANLIDRNNFPLPDSLQAAFESGEPLVLESEHSLSIHYNLPQHNKVLSIHSDQLLGGNADGLAWFFTSVFYLGTLGVVLLWLKPLLNQLHLLRSSTKAFGDGNLEARVNTRGMTYIQDIESDFNSMADQIQQLVEDNKLLTSAVSHDLRTPLARLRFGIDTLKETTPGKGREKYQERINNDLNEMESLVESLLQFARLDNVMEGAEKKTINLRELLEECTAQFYDSEIQINYNRNSLEANDTLEVLGCIEHLATLFNNLIQNALKYSSHSVAVEMHREGNVIVITFSDDGPGIPLAQRAKLMKPFERGDGATGGGYGLGLAVASRIAKHHGGVIDIGSCDRLGGARVSVWLMST